MATSFFKKLQKASWRGLPFATTAHEIRAGRRQAIHEYPNSDIVWVEDTGRATRHMSLVGFLVGDDVINQQKAMLAACEQEGDGILVHPVLGRLTASLIEAPMRAALAGRVVEINFSFVESGAAVFPSIQPASGQNSKASALAMFQAAVGTYVAAIQVAISRGNAVVLQIVSTATSFASQVSNVCNDATNLFAMVANLPETASGIYGRYAGGGAVGFANTGSAPSVTTQTSISTLIASAAALRAGVTAAASAVAAAASEGDPAEIANAVQALVQALLAAIPDPGNGLRLLEGLYGYSEAPVLGTSPITDAVLSAQQATLALCRRAILQALATVASQYQPSSAQDAANVRNQICDLMLEEMVIAGDSGDDTGFVALQAMRAAVAQDLADRGAALPDIVTVNTPGLMPSLVLAQRLYRDWSRADQLTASADPIHPAFMPATFQALAS